MYQLLEHNDRGLGYELRLRADNATRFSVVIGPNGCGKSQLLRSVSEAIRKQHREVSGGTRRTVASPVGEELPQALLVLSNMVTDAFVHSTKQRGFYRYLGLRQASNNTSTSALRDATTSAIFECYRNVEEEDRLYPLLRELGADLFVASFRRINGASRRADDERIVRGRDFIVKYIEGLEDDETRSHHTSSDALMRELTRFVNQLDGDRSFVAFETDRMADFFNICARFELEAPDLIRLMRKTELAEVRVGILTDRSVYELDDMSTGQLLLTSMIARIAAYVQPDSLVLIDEPEAGLHPNWQSAWVPLVRNTIPPNYGCHLLVATHSPYLITDADDVLVPAEEWGAFREFEDPHQGRSIENILYRVFGARVVGNQMVENDMQLLISLIAGDRPPTTSRDYSNVVGALRRLNALAGPDTELLSDVLAQASEVLGE